MIRRLVTINTSVHSSVIPVTRLNSTVKDLLVYLFDLSPLDFEILLFLIKIHPESISLEDLSKKVDRDKSTVFRSLKRLVIQRIVTKETRTMKERGYFHAYASIDKRTLKIETEKRVTEIKNNFNRLLKHFEDDLDITLQNM
ncbi:MAG TPA: MarR family transcriptional regulator [Nitrososphaeraceae archaeon]|nr:MarR family transcriptional regulator [Nitrososphaeraceae archaeon]